MSRPVLWPESPIDILTDTWRPGTFRRWTRAGALVTTQGGHDAIVPDGNIRPAHVDVPRYVPLWDREAKIWRLLDNEHDQVARAGFAEVGVASTMSGHLNSGDDKRSEYNWIPE